MIPATSQKGTLYPRTIAQQVDVDAGCSPGSLSLRYP